MHRLGLSLLLVVGCGDSDPISDDTASGPTGTSNAEDSLSTGAGPGPTSATMDGSSSDSSQDTTTGQGNAEYRAEALPTGVPRLSIYRADSDNNNCVWISMAAFDGGPGPFTVDTPMGWAIESVQANADAQSCQQTFPEPMTESATAGTGAIEFEVPASLIPDTIDNIDAEFTFPGAAPGVPAGVRFVASDIPIAF